MPAVAKPGKRHPNSERRKAGREVAPLVRGAFIRAVKRLEEGGQPLSSIIMRELQHNPIPTLKAISAFLPKEITGKLDHNHAHTHAHVITNGLQESLRFIESFATPATPALEQKAAGGSGGGQSGEVGGACPAPAQPVPD